MSPRAEEQGTDVSLECLVQCMDLFRTKTPVRAALSALFLDAVVQTVPDRNAGVLELCGFAASASRPCISMRALPRLGLATLRFVTADPLRLALMISQPDSDRTLEQLGNDPEWSGEAANQLTLLDPLLQTMTNTSQLSVL